MSNLVYIKETTLCEVHERIVVHHLDTAAGSPVGFEHPVAVPHDGGTPGYIVPTRRPGKQSIEGSRLALSTRACPNP
jgi:hypothetical protein